MRLRGLAAEAEARLAEMGQRLEAAERAAGERGEGYRQQVSKWAWRAMARYRNLTMIISSLCIYRSWPCSRISSPLRTQPRSRSPANPSPIPPGAVRG